MAGTRVYNKDGEQIYPISKAENIISNALVSEGDVEECLLDIYKRIGELTGDEEAVNSIKVEIGYKKATTRDEAEIKESTGSWGAFTMPSADYPYIWKKTVFTYKGKEESELNTVYEIVAAYPEMQHTIYKATDGTVQPTITYEKNDEGEPDYQEVDYIAQGWQDQPISLSAQAPYVYMATRKKEDGLWGPFSLPVLYGRWAFDSQLELRYAVSPSLTPPELDKSNPNPSGWESEITEEFPGQYLWIITATSVNGQVNIDTSGNIWKGPNLISKM